MRVSLANGFCVIFLLVIGNYFKDTLYKTNFRREGCGSRFFCRFRNQDSNVGKSMVRCRDIHNMCAGFVSIEHNHHHFCIWIGCRGGCNYLMLVCNYSICNLDCICVVRSNCLGRRFLLLFLSIFCFLLIDNHLGICRVFRSDTGLLFCKMILVH